MPLSFKTLRDRLRQFFSSIRFRLTLWSLVILSLVLVIFSSVVYTRELNDLKYLALNQLEARSHQMQMFYHVIGNQYPMTGNLLLPQDSDDGMAVVQGNEAVALFDASNGKIIQQIGPITAPDVNQLVSHWNKSTSASNGPFAYQLAGVSPAGQGNNQQYFFLMTPVQVMGYGMVVLVMGTPLDPGGQLPALFVTLLLASLATLLIALLGGYWLAGRAMRPVKKITQAAREIGETDLRRRLHLRSHDELGELADTFDDMLARLQAAFERQRQFTADASHELRTPLTIVDLEADRALSKRRSPEEYERALTVIKSENEFMSRLVNELLILARMDAGQTMIKSEELDLSDLALEVVERLHPLAKRRGIELSTGELPELLIKGDRQFLIQMLTNLVENAIKYSEGPNQCVQVETGVKSEGSNHLAWVKVIDHGPGIPPEDLPHIFERFYRVDKARSRQTNESQNSDAEDGRPVGSGLGLSIVQWIVRAHAGQVKVESELGKGTTFIINLPLVSAPA
ncbi:MAG: HAMP domain-containing sensor histidine kinase [Anaerolineaceae bacterium]|nr:HAMP domain-containing sensor histidine kinase [Anaerolineaceae bacterium]